MNRRTVWGVLVGAGAVSLAACAAPAPEPARGRVAATSAAINSCRQACFVFARLTCRQVEEQCGRYAGQIVLDGDPFPCSEAEPIACHLGTTDALPACLDDCGGDDYPYQGGDNPHPDPNFRAPVSGGIADSGGSGDSGGDDGSSGGDSDLGGYE